MTGRSSNESTWTSSNGSRENRRGRRAGRCREAAQRRRRDADNGTGRRRSALVTRIHQVLATLGYGDAIGHEVLGIQRVLRAAAHESDIFVEVGEHLLES